MKRRKQQGIALISAMIILAAIIIIAGIATYVIIKLAKLIPNGGGGGGGTNHITQVDFPIVESYLGEEQSPITLPNLVFPEIGAVAGTSPENPFGVAHVEIERTTNMIDWEVICIVTNPTTLLMDYDTNKPPESAFYRGKFVIP